jgi:hypothetical protein
MTRTAPINQESAHRALSHAAFLIDVIAVGLTSRFCR